MCRGTAKALLAKVYATIGSASMKSGNIIVKGGPGSVTNPDGTKSRLMPQAITHKKDLVSGYEVLTPKSIIVWRERKHWKLLTIMSSSWQFHKVNYGVLNIKWP